MAVLDRMMTRVRHWMGGSPPAPPVTPRPAGPPRDATTDTGHVATSGKRFRLSEDNPTINYLQGLTILAPFDPERRWRNLSLDEGALDSISTAELGDLLAGLSPEISCALWHYVRLANPGWEVKAFKLGTNSEVIDKRSQAALDQFLKVQLRSIYGTSDLPIDRLFINAFLRGAFQAELVLDNRGKMPLDLALPDPQWTYFRIAVDKERGPVWEPYQFQHGRPVPLTWETIRYIPIDPLPASPYGRAMIQPATFTTLFAISLLHDLKRVVQQQGYPRIDLTVDLEKLAQSMPADLPDDPKAFQLWVDSVIQDVGRMYNSLEPDDAYAHTSNIVVGRPVGTLDTSSLGAIDSVMAYLDRQAVRALKTMPLLLGINEASSETHANRQWEVFIAGIKSHQHTAEQLLEHLLTLALSVQGLQARVEFRFSEVRAAELLRDAQVEQLQIANAAMKYARGWISQDEAALDGAGRAKADQPTPRIPSAAVGGGGATGAPSGSTPAGQVQADPGSTKATPVVEKRELVTNGNGKH